MNQRQLESFMSKVITRGEDECWGWLGPDNGKEGYGLFYAGGKTHLIHRLFYEHIFGPIPKGLVIRHICHNRKCLNPKHLLAGTQQENIQDSVRDGRMAGGSRNGRARLTEKEVLEIRELHHSRQVSLRTLADKYGVSDGAIQNIVYRRSWQYL
jgi:hypothetical protein